MELVGHNCASVIFSYMWLEDVGALAGVNKRWNKRINKTTSKTPHGQVLFNQVLLRELASLFDMTRELKYLKTEGEKNPAGTIRQALSLEQPICVHRFWKKCSFPVTISTRQQHQQMLAIMLAHSSVEELHSLFGSWNIKNVLEVYWQKKALQIKMARAVRFRISSSHVKHILYWDGTFGELLNYSNHLEKFDVHWGRRAKPTVGREVWLNRIYRHRSTTTRWQGLPKYPWINKLLKDYKTAIKEQGTGWDYDMVHHRRLRRALLFLKGEKARIALHEHPVRVQRKSKSSKKSRKPAQKRTKV